MKTIDTHLTEKQFLARLARFSREKVRWDIGYADSDVFVHKLKGKKFWLGKHYAHVGKSDGYHVDRLNCSYRTDENGFVVVSYRYGKHPLLFVPHLIAFAFGLPICVSIVLDVFLDKIYEFGGLIVAALFLIFGFCGFFRSKKELAAQEECLRKICDGNREF